MKVFTKHDLIFNDFNFSELVYVENIRRPFVNIDNKFREGKDKIFYQTSRLRPPVIEIDIRCIRETRAEVERVKQELIKYLYTTKPKKLITRDSGMYDMAVLSGDINWERFLNTASCTLTFQTIYPYQFGMTHMIEIKHLDILIPRGSYPTRGIFEITLPSNLDSLKLTNYHTSEYVKVDHSMLSGRVLKIDCVNETVSYDYMYIMSKVDIRSDFFDLIPNQRNEIHIEGSNKAVLTYTERWL